MKESDLYRPVAKFLEKRYCCDPQKTWTAGCGKDLSFPSGFRKRKPDVVTVRYWVNGSQEHLVEGKLLKIAAHGFEETLNQLDNVRPYADRLWAVFPERQWQDAGTNHERWIAQLHVRGYGLLLVNKDEVRMEFEALSNSQMDEARKNELIEELIGPEDIPVSVPLLGTEAAAVAAKAVARVVELMAGPVREVLAPRGRESSFVGADFYDSLHKWVLVGSYQKLPLIVQGDPFGVHLRDGRPVVWVWHNFDDLETDESKIRSAMAKEHPQDAFYYAADEEGWNYECRLTSELSIEKLKATRLTGVFCLGRPISVDGRSKAGFKQDLKRVLAWANGLRRKA